MRIILYGGNEILRVIERKNDGKAIVLREYTLGKGLNTCVIQILKWLSKPLAQSL